MAGESLRALEALAVKCKRDEDAATETLVARLGVQRDAERARAEAEQIVRRAEAALEQARALAKRGASAGCTALELGEASRFEARRREECARARADLARTEALLEQRRRETAAAQQALAEAKGRREAVERRIEAAKAAERRAQEAKAEDEAGDRAAAAYVARAGATFRRA